MSMFEETTAPLSEYETVINEIPVEVAVRSDVDHAGDGFELVFPINAPLPMKKYKIGDVFGDGVYLGLGTFYRAWHLRIQDPRMGRREVCTKVGVRFHMAYPDGLLLFIDGCVRFMYNPAISNVESRVLSFKAHGHQFDITAKTGLTTIDFSMTVNGAPVKEVKETPDIALDELRPGPISINEVRVAYDGKKATVFYQICYNLNGQATTIERRYSEFVVLDEIVRGHISGHLKDTLPTLPGRILNPFINQTSETFIRERKLSLNQYLVGLQGNNKVSQISPFRS